MTPFDAFRQWLDSYGETDYDMDEVRRRLAALETRVEAIEAGARGVPNND